MSLCLCCSPDVKPLPVEPVLWSAQSPAVGLGRINADILLRPNPCRMVANGDAWHQFCMAAYVCSDFYKSRKNMVLAFFSSIYLGIMLPSLAIGNNQYTCFSVGRTAYHSLGSYPGIFYVEDKETGKVGLRDRYGLLVKPEYESFRYHTPSHWFGELELRKNGYYILYDICNDKYRSDDDIDHQLQDHICQIVEKHLAECSYQADDRLEVKVTVPSTNKTLAHVKVLKNGTVCYYDYDKAPYIPTDSLANAPGAIACDTSVQFKWCQKNRSVICKKQQAKTRLYTKFK